MKALTEDENEQTRCEKCATEEVAATSYTRELEKLLIESENIIKNLKQNLSGLKLENQYLSAQLTELRQKISPTPASPIRLNEDNQSILIKLNDGRGNLGVSILPCEDSAGGMVIQNILPGGRVDKNGGIAVGDKIVAVNDLSLLNLTFDQAQEILREASQLDEMTLRIVKCSVDSGLEQYTNTISRLGSRKLGRKYHVRLIKGADGLGFSIATKDNPAGDSSIYVKSIFPRGAAIKDGALKSGDRILQVNGIDILRKKLQDVVSILKSIQVGNSVDLIIARQEQDISPNPSLPRPLPGDKAGEIPNGHQSEVFTFDIPSNDTSSAGLGISVKCLQSKDESGLSNDDAYALLQKSFSIGDGLNSIRVTIARKLQSPENEKSSEPTDADVDVSDNVGTKQDLSTSSYNSCDNTVIHFNDHQPVSNRLHGRTPSIHERLISNSGDISINEDANVTVDLISTSSYKSCDNTVIHNPKPMVSPNDQLEVHFNDHHPVSNRLHGRTPSVRDRVMPNSGDMSPNRSDIFIENDTGNFDCDETNQTIPKSIEDMDDTEANVLKHVESVTSINNDCEIVFARDGFGRQSVSEKRFCAKAKEEREKERQKLRKEYGLTSPKTPSKERNANTPSKPARGERSASKNLPLFSPKCCWSCQSPGSCPYHVAPSTKRVGPNLGLKKSCSLESLQTMMQELQKDQLDGQEGNPFAGPRPATLKVSRIRTTNESFRVAVDKSYDDGVTETQKAMETLNEEESENNSYINIIHKQQQQQHPPHQHHHHLQQPQQPQLQQLQQQHSHYQQPQPQSQQQHQLHQQHQLQKQHQLHQLYQQQSTNNILHHHDVRPPRHHNMDKFKQSEATVSSTGTSSQFTSTDDDSNLIKNKNSDAKKGLFRTLLRLGSGKKNKSKSTRTEDYNQVRAAQEAMLEREKVQEAYNKLKDQYQHQHQQQHQQQHQYQHQHAHQHAVQTQVKSTVGLPNLLLNHFSPPSNVQFSQQQNQLAPHQSQQAYGTLPSASDQQMKNVANHIRTSSGRMNAAPLIGSTSAGPGYVERQYQTLQRSTYGATVHPTYDAPYGVVKRNVYSGSYRSTNVNNRQTVYWANSGATTTDASFRRPHKVYVEEYSRPNGPLDSMYTPLSS
ncbi:uncharacterized protein LOC107372153 isoform X2 [Tetranychus urticae]|uniref:uncharacterized protein LOC107372153 isoform X2 n=1 Tax=Tetranychus urticae TaxID=32264 RepID=UPI00077BD292|nr:uncharacterized protein LOC107372153 isoform X2 [Tetranychus urticae]